MLDAGKLTDRIKALVPVLIPLFISAFRRADELAMAMECRCYRGGGAAPAQRCCTAPAGIIGAPPDAWPALR